MDTVLNLRQPARALLGARCRFPGNSVLLLFGLTEMLALAACVPMTYPVSSVPPPAPTEAPIGLSPPAGSAKMMIFGGEGHKTYLGCLNCSEYAADSVRNQYGTHGSAYSSESIFNHYGQYGSAYSAESACNEYANDPPVIVDESGRFYGRLTLNRYHPQLGVGASFMAWLAAACRD
jgi:hypothetical protein